MAGFVVVAALFGLVILAAPLLERLMLRVGGRMLLGIGRRAPAILAVFGVTMVAVWLLFVAVAAWEARRRTDRPS